MSSELPPGTEVEGIYPHGASYWTRTAEIATRKADGSPLFFFLKVRIIYENKVELIWTTVLGAPRRQWVGHGVRGIHLYGDSVEDFAEICTHSNWVRYIYVQSRYSLLPLRTYKHERTISLRYPNFHRNPCRASHQGSFIQWQIRVRSANLQG